MCFKLVSIIKSKNDWALSLDEGKMSQTRFNVNRENYEALAKQGLLKNNFLAGAFDPKRTTEPEYRLFFVGDAEAGNEGIRSIINGFSRAPHASPLPGYELLNPSWLKQFLEKGERARALEQVLVELMNNKEKKDFEQSDTLNKKRLFLTAYLKKTLGVLSYQHFIGGFSYSPTNIFSPLLQDGLAEDAKAKWVPRFNNQGTGNEGVSATYMFTPLKNGTARVLCFVRVKNLTFLNTQSNDTVEEANLSVDETYAQFMLQQNEAGKWGWQLLNFQTKDPFMAKIIQGKELVSLAELETRLGKTAPKPEEGSNLISALSTNNSPAWVKPNTTKTTPTGFLSRKNQGSAQVTKRAEKELRADASSVNLTDALKQGTPSEFTLPAASITTSFKIASSKLEPAVEPVNSPQQAGLEDDLIIIRLNTLINKYKQHIEGKLRSSGIEKSKWEEIAAQAYDNKNLPAMGRAKRLAFRKYHALTLLNTALNPSHFENDPKEILEQFKQKLRETRGVLDRRRNWYDLRPSEGSKITDQIMAILNEQQLRPKS